MSAIAWMLLGVTLGLLGAGTAFVAWITSGTWWT